MDIKYIILNFPYMFMKNAELRRLLVVLGAVIIMLSGLLAFIGVFISGIFANYLKDILYFRVIRFSILLHLTISIQTHVSIISILMLIFPLII